MLPQKELNLYDIVNVDGGRRGIIVGKTAENVPLYDVRANDNEEPRILMYVSRDRLTLIKKGERPCDAVQI